MNVDEIRNRVLRAREQRTALRERCSQSGNNSLSLSLNIPGYPKTTPLFAAFFDDVLSDFNRFLQAHRIPIDTTQEVMQIDEAGDFYLVPLNDAPPLPDIKTLTEAFEEHHPLGRMIDIDLTDRQLQPVSSGKLKQCLLCELPAVVCMREANHTYEELREHVVGRIQGYLADKAKQVTCKHLGALALDAILYEISLSPKPGLVGRFEQGSHHDMDYYTFLTSTSAIAGHFEELAQSGYDFEKADLREALPAIRAIGLKMEACMFSATNGINTQKGLVFLIGLSLFSAAYVIAREGKFFTARCRETIAVICANIVQNELMTATGKEQTHGKDCFQQYGSEGGGIRKEAENGLPSVFEHGLPELRSAIVDAGGIATASQINRSLTKTLLRLMTVTSDSNILYRKGIHTLKTVQRMAQHVLDAKNQQDEAERYEQLLSYCQREYVSPGGSADLLAITLFLHFVEQSFSAALKSENTD